MRPDQKKQNQNNGFDTYKIVYVILASLTLFFSLATIACGIVYDLLSPISLSCLLMAVIFGIFIGITYMLRFRLNIV